MKKGREGEEGVHGVYASRQESKWVALFLCWLFVFVVKCGATLFFRITSRVKGEEEQESESKKMKKRYEKIVKRLVAFYSVYNPEKLHGGKEMLDHIASQYIHNEKRLYMDLERKYVRRSKLFTGELQRERAENIFAFLIVCRRKGLPERDVGKLVWQYARDRNFWEFVAVRDPREYFGDPKLVEGSAMWYRARWKCASIRVLLRNRRCWTSGLHRKVMAHT